ncbi:MAG: photosynthetic reaction center cytochrome PufC [Burkholderiaceae bacterium]
MNQLPRHSLLVICAVSLLSACERPPIDSVQSGYRGTGMVQVYNPRILAKEIPKNQPPEVTPPVPEGGPAASSVYKNVPVLGNLGVGEFTRTMVAITAWVSPKEGCAYCHVPGEDFSADTKYQKVVARKMLTMTHHINGEWKNHVGGTGVTCYTCHRGQPVPANIWFTSPVPSKTASLIGDKAGQNTPAKSVGLSSLPYDPNTPFLLKASDIRVNGETALPTGNRDSIKQAEHTYGLMMHMSSSLGVNCTYCHNSRNFAGWDQAPPQRVTAYHGIRMARDLNNTYMEPLTTVFPAASKGPTGDVPKLNCATCHQGAYKPLYGAAMAKDYPAMRKIAAPPAPPPAAAPAPIALPAKVFFETGSNTLTAEAKGVIASALETLKTTPDLKVTLSGFADKRGAVDKNMELSKQRAFAVRDALKEGGIAEDRIILKKPEFVIGDAVTAESRRVEINVAQPGT